MDAVLAGLKPLPAATKFYLESFVPGVETESISTENRPSTPSKSSPDTLFFVRESDEKSSSKASERPRAAQGLFVPLDSPFDSSPR
jgi:hypothetical protein